MNITIRPFRETDQDHVIKLWEKVFPDAPLHSNPARDIRTKREIQPELYLVALLGDQIVGAVMAGCDGNRGWIHNLGVDPDYQRRGIGKSLIKRVESGLMGMGCLKLNLQIRANDTDVQRFYESLGYHAEDSLSMGKEL